MADGHLGIWSALATIYPESAEQRCWNACPREHWRHLRTTNIIESPFAAVRLRTTAAKRFKKVENATALIWETLLVVEQHFRKLNAPHLCTTVYDGVTYCDGVLVIPSTRELRAA